MEFGSSESVLETSDDFKTYETGIQDINIMITLLTQLYNDLTRIIVQEYVANARDAHREIHKDDVPIDITLPTKFSNELAIRDYGPGISPDRMANVFVNNEGVAIYVHEDDTWGEWYIEFRILCDMLEQAKYVDCSIVLREWYLKYILNKFDGTLLTKIHIQIFEVSHTIWDNDYEHFIEYMDIK